MQIIWNVGLMSYEGWCSSTWTHE